MYGVGDTVRLRGYYRLWHDIGDGGRVGGVSTVPPRSS